MSRIKTCDLPANALLRRYADAGAYTDCYCTDVDGTIALADYVEAFYTTWLFKLERAILRWAVKRPSTDAEARELGLGMRETFAAWRVEDRNGEQILLGDYMGRTKSWLMVGPVEGATGKIRLYFGSAVVGTVDGRGNRSMGIAFQALLRFHRLYSVALLGVARARLLQLKSH